MPQSSVETGLFSLLAGNAAVVAACDGVIVPYRPAEGPPPPRYLTFYLVSNPRIYTLGGPAALGNARFQLDCWARTYAAAAALATAVTTLLSGYSGAVPDNSITVKAAFIEDESDGFESPLAEGGDGYFRRTIDLTLWSNN